MSMVGKQVRFYMLPEDEQRFLDFVLQESYGVLLSRISPEPRPHVLHGSLEPTLKSILLWNTAFPIDSQDIHHHSRKNYSVEQITYIDTADVFYSVDVANAPVIEFRRSFIHDNSILSKGRIWAAMYRLVGDTFLPKPAEFNSWYDQIAQWLRHNLRRTKGLDGYVGDAALAWCQRGGNPGKK